MKKTVIRSAPGVLAGGGPQEARLAQTQQVALQLQDADVEPHLEGKDISKLDFFLKT